MKHLKEKEDEAPLFTVSKTPFLWRPKTHFNLREK
jgi:hypothetical protein